MPRRRLALLPALGLAFLLIGCESGGGPSVAPPPPGTPDATATKSAQGSKLKTRQGVAPSDVGISKD